MRELTIADHNFEVRGLTRGELKALRDEGINLLYLTPRTAEEAMDRVFDIVLSAEFNEFLDSRPNRDALEVWRAILAETYGSEEEEKN